MSNSSSASDGCTLLSKGRQSSPSNARTWLFVDAAVDGYATLAAGVMPGVEVEIVNSDEDGIERITQVLTRCRDIAAVHIVSHGSPGCLYLGNSILTLATLDRYSPQLTQWSESLAPDGEILIYGCNVAAVGSQEASTFLHRLHHLTGANLAASSTPVGHAALGGNWKLDRRIGNIRASQIFPPELQQAYPSILVQFSNRNFPVGQNPVAIAIGNFNRDGNQDLAVVNRDSNNISVLFGTNTGGFSFETFTVAGLPSDVAVGDFNNDGNQDLAVTSRENAQVSILLGNGSRNFNLQQSFEAGTFPRSLTVGDFNLDGNEDLAVANRDSNDVSILLGEGTGIFTPQTTFETGVAPFEISTADFNNDENPDVAVINRDSDSVSVLLGDGTGEFAPHTTFEVGGGPRGITVGDFNNDGNPDIAVANRDNNDVSVLLGDGNGEFSPQTRYSAGNRPHSVTVGDFDGDGNQDLVVANLGFNNVSVLLGDGNGDFGSQMVFGTGIEPRAVVAGDFNGQGNDDIAVANRNANTLSLLSNNLLGVTISGPEVPEADVMAGTENHILYRIDLQVRNIDTSLTGVTVTTDGTYEPSDLVPGSFELFLSADDELSRGDISLQTQDIVASGEEIAFSGFDRPLAGGDRVSLFVVADIAPTAVPTRTINIGQTDFSNVTLSAGDKLGISPILAGGEQTIVPSPTSPPPEPLPEPDPPAEPQTPSRPIIELPDSSIPPDPNYDACQLVNNLLIFPSLNLSSETLGGGLLFGDENPNTLDARAAEFGALVGLDDTDKLLGSSGDDLIFGNQGRDVIVTGDGVDRIFAGRENDGVNGNEDDDTIAGELGNDHLMGENGNDVIFGNAGIDLIDGGAGDDLIFAGQHNDGAVGGEGNDVILGNLGNDCLHGEEGNDELFGNQGVDFLIGGDGSNTLHGGQDNDVLVGGRENDVLIGDLGSDSLWGGNGGDRFDFRPGDGNDTIADFTNNEDLIGLKNGLSFDDLTIAQVGSNTQITAEGISIILEDVNAAAIGVEDFVSIT